MLQGSGTIRTHYLWQITNSQCKVLYFSFEFNFEYRLLDTSSDHICSDNRGSFIMFLSLLC